MHIEKLHIQNFRGLQEITLNFPSTKLAVIIGINGAGKSSVLDCIAMMLAQFIALLRNKRTEIHLTENDININSILTVNTITISSNQEQKVSWKMCHYRPNQQQLTELNEIESYIKELQSSLKLHPDFNLPVMVYYQTQRMVLKNPSTFKNKGGSKAKKELYNQFYAYEKAFSVGINDFQDFFDWFREEEDYENEIRLRENRDYRNEKLEIVRKAIDFFLERSSNSHFSNLRVVRSTANRDFSFDQISSQPSLTITKNSQDLRLEQLSDGEKMLLMLVTDLARRLTIANPSSSDGALSGEGIVLIDAIDLHLHPQWQRTVVRSLTQTFPNCQFIVTTHSPQVLSGVERENVFILENSQLVENTPHTYGKDSNSILYELMNVKERPDEVQRQIDNCFQLIDNGHIEQAKQALNKLSDLLGGNDSVVVRANVLMEFLEE